MNKNNKKYHFAKDIAYGMSHELFDDDLGQSLLQAWRLGICDKQLKEMIQKRVDKERVRQIFHTPNPMRRPRLPNGEIIWGFDDRKKRFVPIYNTCLLG